MSPGRKVIVYGASGYTGKLIAESLAQRRIPFYFAGRSRDKLDAAIAIVRERLGGDAWKLDAEVVAVDNSVEALLPLFRKCSIVINVAGPFMQVAWPVVEAALQGRTATTSTPPASRTGRSRSPTSSARSSRPRAGCWPLPRRSCGPPARSRPRSCSRIRRSTRSTSSTRWTTACRRKPRRSRSCAWCATTPRSTTWSRSEYKAWPNDVAHDVFVPYRSAKLRAHPWGGACEPVWLKERVRNCRVLTAIGEHMIDPIIQAIRAFNEQAPGLDQAGREALTNAIADQISTGEPPKDHPDVQRGVIVVHGQGRTRTTSYVMNLSAAYTWTGEISAGVGQADPRG